MRADDPRNRIGRDKFDFQLSRAEVRERALEKLLGEGMVELKTESWQWEDTGNLAVEYAQEGRPSGIATTAADVWAHELCDRDGETRVWLLFPIERLKRLAREAIARGDFRLKAGDGQRTTVALIPLRRLIYGLGGKPRTPVPPSR